MYNFLKCPTCGHSFAKDNEGYECSHCKHKIPTTEEGVPIFINHFKENEVKIHNTQKSLLKSSVKKIFFAPHHSTYSDLTSSHSEPEELLALLKQFPPESVILNIGSLSKNLQRLHKGILNLDICYYPNIDFIADACDLPFRDESIDMVIFKNVLEHVKNPMKALSEIRRVLKKGGILYTKIPFLQPFHAVPDDFQRYTKSGFRGLFKDYQELDFGVSVGGGLCYRGSFANILRSLPHSATTNFIGLAFNFGGG